MADGLFHHDAGAGPVLVQPRGGQLGRDHTEHRRRSRHMKNMARLGFPILIQFLECLFQSFIGALVRKITLLVSDIPRESFPVRVLRFAFRRKAVHAVEKMMAQFEVLKRDPVHRDDRESFRHPSVPIKIEQGRYQLAPG